VTLCCWVNDTPHGLLDLEDEITTVICNAGNTHLTKHHIPKT